MKEIANIDRRMSQAEVEARKAEKDNQQLEDECTKCNKVQWQSIKKTRIVCSRRLNYKKL